MISARMPGDGAAVVIRQAHFYGGDSEVVEPAADVGLLFPPGISLLEHYDGGAGVAGLKKLSVNEIVLRPRCFDRAGESEHFAVERIIGCWAGGVPFLAVGQRTLDKMIEVSARIGLIRGAADVFEAPGEGERLAIGLLSPAHMLVTSNFSFQ